MAQDILAAVRAAVETARPIAESVRSGTAKFYDDGNTTPFLTCDCRVKKPRPSSFDAGDQTRWATKVATIIKIDVIQPELESRDGIIPSGTIVQVSTPDGDPAINGINFVVQSAVGSQFEAERNISVVSEGAKTPRIV